MLEAWHANARTVLGRPNEPRRLVTRRHAGWRGGQAGESRPTLAGNLFPDRPMVHNGLLMDVTMCLMASADVFPN